MTTVDLGPRAPHFVRDMHRLDKAIQKGRILLNSNPMAFGGLDINTPDVVMWVHPTSPPPVDQLSMAFIDQQEDEYTVAVGNFCITGDGDLYVCTDATEGALVWVVVSGASVGTPGSALTDYENVVVVDPAGNGDYTTLGAAITAITDATAVNKYLIMGFGQTTETANVTWKSHVDLWGGRYDLQDQYYIELGAATNVVIRGVTILGGVTVGANTVTAPLKYAVLMDGCVIAAPTDNEYSEAVQVNGSGGSTYLSIVGSSIMAGTNVACLGLIGSGGGRIVIEGCVIDNNGAGTHNINVGTTGACQNVLSNCVIAGGGPGVILGAGSNFFVNNCLIWADGNGVSVGGEPAATSLVSDCTVFSPAGNSFTAAAPITWGRVHHCLLNGALNNVTPEAGTARGSNIEV